MTCTRKHSKWFQVKLVGQRKHFCTYILGYKLGGDSVTNVLQCGDLPKNEPIPENYLQLTPIAL